MERFIGGPLLATIIRLLLISFAAGLVIAMFGIDYTTVWRDLSGAITYSGQMMLGIIKWSFQYIVSGAIIVVPVWFVIRATKALASHKGTSAPKEKA